MLTAGARRIAWPGGTHIFCLTACGMVMTLEDRRRTAIAMIYSRLANSVWYSSDIRETVRLALIGGGLSDRAADELVQRFVDRHEQGLMGSVPLAMTILEPVIVGVPDDKPDELAQPTDRAEKFQHDDGRLKRSAILGLGAGLGWTVSQTYAASVWEIAACIRGHNKANGPGGPEPPSNEEFDAMLERHKIRVH
jgi:Phage tail tube protein, GTA-gp10